MRNERESMSSPSVVVTGASKGIGRATALFLALRGFRVFAGVRSASDGEKLSRDGGERLSPLSLEVTDHDGAADAAQEVAQQVGDGGIQGLVNNAGIVVGGPLEGLPIDDFRHQLEVNLVGVLAVTKAFLPLLRSGNGRIVNVSSINGRMVTPFATPYAVSKFALEALSDGLRMELRRWGIRVSVIQPGAIDTPIWETSQLRAVEIAERMPESTRELYGGVIRSITEMSRRPQHAIPPERVARVIHHALAARRPRTRYLVGLDARVGALLRKVLPDRAMDRILLRRRSRKDRDTRER
jgi:NAD(P)-dependent dehydrogenase (short-subunit alcohol dehydrogenase family)